MEAQELFTEAALKAIDDETNWKTITGDNEPCAVCKKGFDEDEVPLLLWTDDGKKMITFHFECALLKSATNEMDKLAEGINYWKEGFKNCPDCGSPNFLEGPHGGHSVNIKCKKCGATFNWMGPFGIERI